MKLDGQFPGHALVMELQQFSSVVYISLKCIEFNNCLHI